MRASWIAWALLAGCNFDPVPASSLIDAGTSGSNMGSNGSNGSGNVGSGSNASCTAGARVCVDATDSGSCNSAGQAVADRACPPGSMCGSGYCQPPVGAMSCTTDTDCPGNGVCDPYVVSGAFQGFCTGPDGSHVVYESCSGTSSPGCDTGVCVNGQCFSGCKNQSDCPSADSVSCTAGSGTLEGVSISGLKSCFNSD